MLKVWFSYEKLFLATSPIVKDKTVYPFNDIVHELTCYLGTIIILLPIMSVKAGIHFKQ